MLFVALAAALLPAQDAGVEGATPEPRVRAGAWRVIGPFRDRRAPAPGSPAGPQRAADEMQAGRPWAALRESYEGAGGVVLQWMEPDAEAAVARARSEVANPRPLRGLDSGPLEVRLLLPHVRVQEEWQEEASVFLYRPVYAGVAHPRSVTLGSDDGLRVWWNGRVVADHAERRTLDPGEHEVTLAVEPGVNHLLVKLAQARGPWRFEMREPRPVSAERVNRAIDLGVEYLLSRQLIDGSWRGHEGYRNGVTSIAVYTLLKSGLPPDHPAVLQGLAWLELEPARHTYSLALQVMATAAREDPADLPRIQEMADRLVAWQNPEGLWGYPSGNGDLSNTQYAALGLWAAARRGAEVPDATWRGLRDAVLSCQPGRSGARSGSAIGFGYRPGTPRATASMTAAAVGTLAICRNRLADRDSRGERAVEQGVEWLARNCPLHRAIRPGTWSYYTVYGLERAGGLTGRERFGEHAWYREGAAILVEQQAASGGWEREDPDLVTCFALLFLRRATSRTAVTQVALDDDDRLLRSSPEDGPLLLRGALNRTATFWVDATSERFDEIERVVYWIRPPGGAWAPVEESGGRRRFTIRHALDRPGRWQVRASAFLADGSTLGSGILVVPHEEGITPERLAYVNEAGANRAPAGHPEVHASSTGGRDLPRHLVDGRYRTRWSCGSADDAPRVELRFSRSVAATRLALVPAARQDGDPWPLPRARLARVVINGEHEFLARIPPDPHRKAGVEFDEELRVRTLTIEILGTAEGPLGEVMAGFAEIELF